MSFYSYSLNRNSSGIKQSSKDFNPFWIYYNILLESQLELLILYN